MFIHTCISAPKRFAKFGWETRTFCHKKWKRRLPKSSQTDYSTLEKDQDGTRYKTWLFKSDIPKCHMRHCNVRVISITNAFPSQGSTSQASEALLWTSNVFWNLKAPSVTAVHLDMHYRWVSYMFRLPVTQDNDYMRMVSTYPTIREAREYALCTFSNCVHCIYWSPVWIEYLVSVHNQKTCYVYLAPVYIEYRICVHNQNTWSVYLAPVYIE